MEKKPCSQYFRHEHAIIESVWTIYLLVDVIDLFSYFFPIFLYSFFLNVEHICIRIFSSIFFFLSSFPSSFLNLSFYSSLFHAASSVLQYGTNLLLDLFTSCLSFKYTLRTACSNWHECTISLRHPNTLMRVNDQQLGSVHFSECISLLLSRVLNTTTLRWLFIIKLTVIFLVVLTGEICWRCVMYNIQQQCKQLHCFIHLSTLLAMGVVWRKIVST